MIQRKRVEKEKELDSHKERAIKDRQTREKRIWREKKKIHTFT